MNYEIPCETLVRLHQLTNKETVWTNSIRLEGNLAVAGNDRLLVVEKLNFENPTNPVHVVIDDALLKQIKTEAPFKSTLTITVVNELNFASCKTTLGYNHPENCAVWNVLTDNHLDRWKTLIPDEKNTESVGGMFWNTAEIELLGRVSPTGCIVFQEKINVDKPIVVRDRNDPNWFGIFIGSTVEKEYKPATVPDWMKL